MGKRWGGDWTRYLAFQFPDLSSYANPNSIPNRNPNPNFRNSGPLE